jgi:hypothetical protein
MIRMAETAEKRIPALKMRSTILLLLQLRTESHHSLLAWHQLFLCRRDAQ